MIHFMSSSLRSNPADFKYRMSFSFIVKITMMNVNPIKFVKSAVLVQTF